MGEHKLIKKVKMLDSRVQYSLWLVYVKLCQNLMNMNGRLRRKELQINIWSALLWLSCPELFQTDNLILWLFDKLLFPTQATSVLTFFKVLMCALRLIARLCHWCHKCMLLPRPLLQINISSFLEWKRVWCCPLET